MFSRRGAFSFANERPILLGGALCLDFINTIGWRGDPIRTIEFIPSYSELVHWSLGSGVLDQHKSAHLIDEGLRNPAKSTAALEVAKELRVELESAFDPDLRQSTNLSIATAILRSVGDLEMLVAGADGLRWTSTATGSDILLPLVPVAISGLELATSRKREMVKRCADQDCAWLFIDDTRNHSRRWCSMEDCGNRAKAGAHYARRKQNF
ncbi:hypothetical protein ASD04_00020 [Devosia sp. Root436]|nr:hypothetical protein ASD04_00020 [Devosia sp. Root436]